MTDIQQTTPDHKDLWRLEQLALVSQVATQVTNILDLDELLVRVVGLIYQTFQFYVVCLYTLKQDVLVLKAQAGPDGSFTVEDAFIPPEGEAIPLGRGIIGWVAEHQQELVVSDVSQEDRFCYSAEFPHTRAEVALPLKIETDLLGVLDVQLDDAAGFDHSDLLVLRALAGQVSMAIEDTRLYAEAKRRGDYLATVGAVSSAVASILDVDQLLQQVSQLIRTYFDYPFVQIFTIHYGRRQIEYRAGSNWLGNPIEYKKPIYALDDPHGIIPTVARTGETTIINDVSAVPNYRTSEITSLATKSEMSVPLVYNDEVLGVMDAQSDQPDAFSYHDQFIMETLAAHIAVALRNANLYHSERWRHQVAESLRRISGVLITDVNLTSILNTILVELENTLPVDALAIWLIRNKKLRLIAVQPSCSIESLALFDPEQDPWLTKGLTATEPLIRQSNHPADPIAAHLDYAPDHSAIAAPLRVQERTLGLLTLVHNQAGKYGQEAWAVTSAFANQAAIAIENARLFRVAQEEAQINSALLKVAEAIQGFGDLSEVLNAIVAIPPLLAEVDRCAIWVRNDETGAFEPKAAFGIAPNALEFFHQHVLTQAEVVAVELLDQTRAPLVIVDAPTDNRLPNTMTTGLDLDTLVLLPMVAHGDMLGLMLVTFAAPAAIRAEGIRLITGVAYQAAVAIESKFLYNQKAGQERLAHELKLAHDIQADLIPSHLPAPPGWEVAAFWAAMQEVGGDFYDFINVTPDQLGIVIADVSGKGMPAALYMALTRSLIRATAPGRINPGEVLARTNQLLAPDTRRGMFVSVFYAIVDLRTGMFTYANAGHNPPLLLRANGQSETLNLHSIVLGVQPETDPKIGQNALNPGDGVVFYTDGVTEAANTSAILFGEERLRTMLQNNWSASPQAVVEAVCQAVHDFSATALPTDDFTLLVLRRR